MAAGLAALTAVESTAAAADAPTRPNILWITAEDISPNLGCSGDPDAVTPNLDRFAAQSVRFTRVYSVHPCCSPSRIIRNETLLALARIGRPAPGSGRLGRSAFREEAIRAALSRLPPSGLSSTPLRF